jgi:hypothetical protein
MTNSTPEAILAQLDACSANYCDFPMLDNAYIFPADVRLTLYRDRTRWAHIPPDLPAILQLDEWRHPDLAEDELPSQTETFQQLVAVLYTSDPARYAPTVPPNTHWRYWPHGGDGVFFGNATALEG